MNIEMKDCFTVIENNNEFVCLKVKDNFEDELFMLGFISTPKMIRLTKGNVQDCMIKYDNGKTINWHWGMGGHTLVSDELSKLGYNIQHMIEYEFGIPVAWRHTKTDSRDKYFAMDYAKYHRLKNSGAEIKSCFEIW